MLSKFSAAARRARDFASDLSGVSAVEFALSAPLILILFLGGFETANYVRVSLRVATAANSIAEMLSQEGSNSAASVPGNGLLTSFQFHFFWDSIQYSIPDSLDEASRKGVSWWDVANVKMWNIEFKQTSPNVYTPVVVWSSSGGPSCGATINQAPNDSVVTPTTLPASVYGPGSVLVVQINYSYSPIFGGNVFGDSTITRTAILAPRNVPIVEANAPTDNIYNCPGTPF